MNWTFLGNHGHVVVQIAKNPEIKISELAALVGVTERHARAIIRDLRESGYVEVKKTGRRNTYKIKRNMPLRHTAESNHKLSDLLAIFVA